MSGYVGLTLLFTMLCGFVYSSLQRITLQDMDFVVIAYVAITYNNTENIYENQML